MQADQNLCLAQVSEGKVIDVEAHMYMKEEI